MIATSRGSGINRVPVMRTHKSHASRSASGTISGVSQRLTFGQRGAPPVLTGGSMTRSTAISSCFAYFVFASSVTKLVSMNLA